MKQRSLVRDRIPRPGKPFPPCTRVQFLKQRFKAKPCSYGKRDALRSIFKKFYKKQKAKDREFGLQINALWKEFYDEKKYVQKSGKKPDKETVKYIAKLAKQIQEMTMQSRFSKEFPSFSSFYKFVRNEGVTLEDIREEE